MTVFPLYSECKLLGTIAQVFTDRMPFRRPTNNAKALKEHIASPAHTYHAHTLVFMESHTVFTAFHEDSMGFREVSMECELTGTYLQGKSMECFTQNPTESPWKISRVYFTMEIPWGMKPGPLYSRCNVNARYKTFWVKHLNISCAIYDWHDSLIICHSDYHCNWYHLEAIYYCLFLFKKLVTFSAENA